MPPTWSRRPSSDRAPGAMRGPGSMREANERLVLDHLLARPEARSAPQLAADTGLSRPTANQALARLEAAGLVRQSGRRTGQAGRAARLFEPDPDAGRVLAAHVGEGRVRLLLADLSGRVVERQSVEVPDGTDLAAETAQRLTGLLAAHEVPCERVLSVVVGSPGTYDPGSHRLWHTANLPGWDGPALLPLLPAELGPLVRFENDIDLAAVAEHTDGAGRGVDDFVLLSVGDGVGLGAFCGGRLHRGSHGSAGEIAFLLVGAEDPRGPARERGALESAASSDALLAAARAAGLGELAEPAELFALAAAGDAAALAVQDREVDLLARALVAVAAIHDPELVVLGGPALGEHAESLLGPLADRFSALVPLPLPALTASATGADATLSGALAHARRHAWREAHARACAAG
ncbi:ROK family transcriptional regulator [Phaeacidiphilus oryzae]|uniref:ROK family transcriptional regulator n=1 Tax=Phaeacidiphilus oryzae TaxID=348818 RepID=UPI0006902A0A|nr:ROK family transcriptional regulator [Phaeacidiphilus oryzae]